MAAAFAYRLAVEGLVSKMAGILAELRRRNVIRMAGLYLVGAWLVVQVAETLLPIFGTPDWVLKTLVALLALGFVPALVFSWLYELTSEGLKRDAEVTPAQSIASQTGRRMDRLLAVGLVAVVALIAADRFWPRGAEGGKPGSRPGSEYSSGADDVATPVGSQPELYSDPGFDRAGQKSIAVLPFVNMSADKDNEYFSDGISEELLNVLVRVDGIGVASRTSSFAYKGRELGATAIAKELKVDHILEGSVRKAGNRVRITAQLIDATNDRHLWSETYDRELTDIFTIQDEIANAIVTALRGELAADDGAAPAVTVKADTQDLEAYELYLKARELFIARRDIGEAILLAERAVELDPKFARGWEILAALASVAEDWGVRDRDYSALSLVAAKRALDLDPTLSMPWAALAFAESMTLPIDWDRLFASLDRAIAADPRNETAFLWRAIAWMNLGWSDRALADLDQCLALDPAYPNCKRFKALALLHRGDTERALELFQQGAAVGFVRNRFDSFILPLWEREQHLAVHLLLDARAIPVGLREPLLASLVGERPADPAIIAEVERALADPQDALTIGVGISALLWLREFDRAAESPELDSSSISHWERIPGLRNSPAFKRMIERLGVATYWRKHGFPPQCRALGDTDFECDPVP